MERGRDVGGPHAGRGGIESWRRDTPFQWSRRRVAPTARVTFVCTAHRDDASSPAPGGAMIMDPLQATAWLRYLLFPGDVVHILKKAGAMSFSQDRAAHRVRPLRPPSPRRRAPCAAIMNDRLVAASRRRAATPPAVRSFAGAARCGWIWSIPSVLPRIRHWRSVRLRSLNSAPASPFERRPGIFDDGAGGARRWHLGDDRVHGLAAGQGVPEDDLPVVPD